jgi:malonate-semialdehyde dehydrogenase (acetylating) / methylmalonate-semialdehyde dehydrogenase
MSKQQGHSETDEWRTPMKELTHFVDRMHGTGTSGRFCDGFEPMTGRIISRVPLASKAEVRVAVENSFGAQPAWSTTSELSASRFA